MRKCFMTALLVLAVAGSSTAGTVTGKISRTTPVQNLSKVNRYSGRTSVDKAAATSDNSWQPAVVYLTGGPKAAMKVPSEHPKMVQQGQAFDPLVLPIVVGTTVDFPNLDPVYHNVFSYSKAKKFDLGRFPKGQSKSVTFDTPGLVKVFCEIHSSMRAHILVLDQPYFTTTSADGNYRIENVPPGKYTLKIWQDQLPELEFPVTVTDSEPAVVNVD